MTSLRDWWRQADLFDRSTVCLVTLINLTLIAVIVADWVTS